MSMNPSEQINPLLTSPSVHVLFSTHSEP